MNIAALLGGSVQIAGGGPVSIEGRLRGIKLTILGNPLPWLASNLVVHPDIKGIPTWRQARRHLAFRLLHRPGLPLSVPQKWPERRPRFENVADGGDSSRVAALKTGTVQYTFLGAAATDNARALGFRVLSTAQQMAIPFPWTSVVVEESWLGKNRELALPLHEMRHRSGRHSETQPRRQRAHHR